MKKTLSLLLAFMLIAILPVSAQSVSLSDRLNYNAIFDTDVVPRATEFPAVIYSASAFSDTLTLGNLDYSVTEGHSGKENDSIKLTDTYNFALEEAPYKKIGFIAYALNSDTLTNVKIVYKSGDTETFPITVKTASKQADLSVSAGMGLKKGGTGMRPKAEVGETELFINAYEMSPSKTTSISAVEFPASDCVLFAVSSLKYTQEELDNLSDRVIEETLAQYKDKTLTDITDADTDSLESLYNALLTAQENGSAIATDEVIEKIKNLKDGYPLYSKKKEICTYFNDTYAVRDYRTLAVSDLSDSDITVIDTLISKYTEAQSFDNERYAEILSYFNMTDDYTWNLSDKETLTNLKTAYERKKYEEELTSKINSAYAPYKDKTVSDLAESDIAKLQELVALYEEAKRENVPYNADDRAKIEKLLNTYSSYLNSENDECYDLKNYYTGSIVGNAGDTSKAWGFPDGSGYVGYSSDKFESFLTDGSVSVKSQFNYTLDSLKSDPALTKTELAKPVKFKMSDDRTATGKNAILFYSKENKENGLVKSVNILAPKRVSSQIMFLYPVALANVTSNITLNFTDGTTQTQVYGIPWCNYWTQTGLFQSPKYYRNTDTNTVTDGANLTNPSLLCRGLVLDIPKGKIIESINVAQTQGALLAITEVPLLNADFTELVKEQWAKVEAIDTANVSNSELYEVKTMVLYANECEKRGLDIADFVSDTAKMNEFKQMILTVSHTVYRQSKNEVRADFEFSVPVNASDINKNITVLKNGMETADYSVSLSNGGKSLSLILAESKNGGNEYKITLSGNLSLELFPKIKLGSDYTVSYDVPDYLTYSYNGTEFTIKNNSKEEASGLVGVSCLSADNKTMYYSALKEYTVSEGVEVKISCDTSNYSQLAPNTKTVLWDENMKTVSNGGEISACTDEPVLTANYSEPAFSMKDNSIKLNGITPSASENKAVSLKITDESGNVIFTGSQLTAKSGYFNFEFILPDYMYQNSMTLTFTLGGDDFETPQTLSNTIYYYAPGDRGNFIAELKASSESEITAKIPDVKKNLAIAIAPADVISDADYAKMIFNNKDMLLENDPAKTQENLKKLAIITAFWGDNANILMNGSELLYNDLMNFSSIDSDGVTLYSILKSGISEEGIKHFQDEVFGKKYANENELMKKITEEIFLSAINYPSTGGTGYIGTLLTAKNASKVEITITKYLNAPTYDFNNKIAAQRGSFLTLLDVEKFISSYKKPENGSSGGSSGGGGGSSFSSSITEEPAPAPTPAPSLTFNDVPTSHWAYASIISLYNKGIISGKGDKTFAPDDTITRGELVKMLCKAYGFTASRNDVFSDTADKWYNEFACAAYENGIITGISESEFGGDANVTRQDICTMLYRTVNAEVSGELEFADSDSVSDYAKSAVLYMAQNGIINGFSDNTFRAAEYCTRAQAAKIIDMFLK